MEMYFNNELLIAIIFIILNSKNYIFSMKRVSNYSNSKIENIITRQENVPHFYKWRVPL